MAFPFRAEQACLSTLRLDPTHAVEAELAAEASIPRRGVSNSRSIRLIDDDRRRIVLHENMLPLGRPVRLLIVIAFERQRRLILHRWLLIQNKARRNSPQRLSTFLATRIGLLIRAATNAANSSAPMGTAPSVGVRSDSPCGPAGQEIGRTSGSLVTR